MKWKNMGLICGYVISLVVMFSCCYYLSYQHALHQFNESAVERNDELISYLQNITNKDLTAKASSDGDSLAVGAAQEDTVVPDTTFKLESYDIKTNTQTQEVMRAPSKYIGLTREQLIDAISEEMLDVPLEEHQKGLVSYVLVSFSSKEIVLRKSYNLDLVQYQYYLALQDGKIVVYYSDKKTVYEYTGIEASKLSEKAKAELSMGKYVKDDTQLYSLLEGYSS